MNRDGTILRQVWELTEWDSIRGRVRQRMEMEGTAEMLFNSWEVFWLQGYGVRVVHMKPHKRPTRGGIT